MTATASIMYASATPATPARTVRYPAVKTVGVLTIIVLPPARRKVWYGAKSSLGNAQANSNAGKVREGSLRRLKRLKRRKRPRKNVVVVVHKKVLCKLRLFFCDDGAHGHDLAAAHGAGAASLYSKPPLEALVTEGVVARHRHHRIGKCILPADGAHIVG